MGTASGWVDPVGLAVVLTAVARGLAKVRFVQVCNKPSPRKNHTPRFSLWVSEGESEKRDWNHSVLV